MAFKGYRDQSRVGYGAEEEKGCSIEQINCGSFMRIADATERMAIRHTDLIRDRDFFEKEAKRLREIRVHLERSNASLRGHLKRAKAAKS